LVESQILSQTFPHVLTHDIFFVELIIIHMFITITLQVDWLTKLWFKFWYE